MAVLLLPVLYFLPELLGANVFAGIDTSRLNMPLRLFDREAFRSGALPLWNPYMFAGFPHLAESESGVFYPGNIFIHLPGDFFRWYSVEVVAHFMIAAAGFYMWIHRRGNLRATSAFLAATYSLTPFLVFHITAFGLFTSIVWLPWYLVIFETGMHGKHPVRTGLWLALFLAFMLMSGSIQAAFLGVLALLLYALAIILAQPDRQRRVRALMRALAVLLPAIIAPVIAAIQLLPTAELSALSERAATDNLSFYKIGTWLNIPRLISLVVFPALDNPADIQDYGSSLVYLGAIPFAFAAASLARWRTNGRAMFPLVFVGVIALLLGFGLNLPGYTWLVKIPPFSMFRYAGRAEQIALTFFLALAAPSINMLLGGSENFGDKSGRWKMGYLAGAILAILAAFVGIAKGGIVAIGSATALVLGLIALFVLPLLKAPAEVAGKKVSHYPVFILLAMSLVVQVASTYPFSRVLVQKRSQFDKSLQFFSDILAEFPTDQEIPRVLMPGGQYLMDPNAISKLGLKAQEDIWDDMSGNASGLRHVTALNGLTPLNQNGWKEILRDTLQSRLDKTLADARTSGSAPVADDLSVRIIRMLGTDVLLLEGADWQVPGYQLWRTDLALPYHQGLAAYRAIGGWVPDAHFAASYQLMDGQNYSDFLRWIGASSRDIDRSVLITSPIPVASDDEVAPSISGSSTVTGRSRGFNGLTFSVSVDGQSGFLVTGENYYPGWRAFVDGKETAYVQADYVLGGLWVPGGTHTVELRYEPRSVFNGMIGTIAGLIAWAIAMIAVTLVHRKRSESVFPPIDDANPSQP